MLGTNIGTTLRKRRFDLLSNNHATMPPPPPPAAAAAAAAAPPPPPVQLPVCTAGDKQVRKYALGGHFSNEKNHHFTKTGSVQT